MDDGEGGYFDIDVEVEGVLWVDPEYRELDVQRLRYSALPAPTRPDAAAAPPSGPGSSCCSPSSSAPGAADHPRRSSLRYYLLV